MVTPESESSKEKINFGQQIVLFIGPEGSGKSTIAKRLATELGRPYITTGQILRDLAANDQGDLGEKCRRMFADMTYLDGPTLLEILVDRFSQADTAEGFVLDGGLRTIEETVDFGSMLAQSGRSLPLLVIYLDIPREVSFQRLVWGGSARHRSDDTKEGVALRLEKFLDHLDERLAIIENTWELVRIDATGGVDQVYAQVRNSLGNSNH